MIAIDPGPMHSAWILYDDGEVYDAQIEDNHQVETRVECEWIDEPVVIEMVASYGKPVGVDTFETVYWIGRFSHASGGAERVYRKDVKMTLCEDNRAKDTNIRQALIDRFGQLGGKQAAVGTKKAPGPLYGIRKDLWSALAVAVTYELMQAEAA